jgi:hypothetical protein
LDLIRFGFETAMLSEPPTGGAGSLQKQVSIRVGSWKITAGTLPSLSEIFAFVKVVRRHRALTNARFTLESAAF